MPEDEVDAKPVLYGRHASPFVRRVAVTLRLYGIDYDIAPSRPTEGVFAVSVQYLMGGSYVATTPDWAFTTVEPGHAAWLRNYEPVARAGSIWLFDTRGRLHASPGR